MKFRNRKQRKHNRILMSIRYLPLFILSAIGLLVLPGVLSGQLNYSGRVVDVNTRQPVAGAEITVNRGTQKFTTGENGWFSLTTGIGEITDPKSFSLHSANGVLAFQSASPVKIRVINLSGQITAIQQHFSGSGQISLHSLPDGFYLLEAENREGRHNFKILKNNGMAVVAEPDSNHGQHTKSGFSGDSLFISKGEYYSQQYVYSGADGVYPLMKKHYENGVDYFEELIRAEAFQLLASDPSMYPFSEVKSLKLVYSIADRKIYYANSSKYELHYDFCSKILGYNKGQALFAQEQYSNNQNRLYFLATLNYFKASGIYTLEFLPSDQLNCSDIETAFNKVSETCFFGDRLRFYANAPDKTLCTNVPVISADELYAGQNYQPLNVQENYGYLRKIDAGELPQTYLGRHDIVLVNAIPSDIAVVAGIITTEFQTPLSHINVLSHNRGTPNMALRDGWTNPKLTNFTGKLVYFKVALDSFTIREAGIEEAQKFWAKKEPQTVHKLTLDTLTTGLVDLANAGVSWVSTIGGKAANFAEIKKIVLSDQQVLPLPENHFAIPFYYYWQHMKQNKLDQLVNNMLNDSKFKSDINYRKTKLAELQSAIKKASLNPELVEMVKTRLGNSDGFTTFRFRSSTNAEDVEGFNGAGLYESYTGSLTDPEKPIDKAIKKVWASLWDFAAFEERDYFKIDHKTIAMGVLVHRSYPAEAANGVAITENIYNPYVPAITINVQVGEISVVNPGEKYLPDQILYYTRSNADIYEYINHSNVPGMEGKTVMTSAELKELKDYCMAIHNHYCFINLECNPIDIEFKVDVVNGVRKLYIKQARLY